MGTKLKRFNIGKKMYLFVFATVLFTVASVSIISYRILSNQIDTYYKRLTINSAEFYSSVFDGDYLAELRDVIMSDEYQALRDHAEEIDDDSLVIEYLDERGLWDQYQVEREKLLSYVEDMDDIEYLYLIVWSEDPAEDGLYYDMYLVDADDLPFYQAGYWEEREPEFEGVMPEDTIDPVISNGDWGWLCSAYKAIYDSNGNIVCHLGCDVTMDQIMAERSATLISIIASAVLCAVIALIGAFVFVNKTIVRPLKSLTSGMKNFSPAVGKDYDQSGVIDLDIRSSDEIRDVYEETRSMQMRLVDYIRDITTIRKEKEKVSKDAYRDSLTGIGNKTSYSMKVEELNANINSGRKDFAIVMVDVNGLKDINDNNGHSCGDLYLKGCCHLICEIFKHSPVFRIGGDEFVAILHGEDYANKKERVGALKNAFNEAYNNKDLDPWLRYSAAVGMAGCSDEDSSVDSVFKRADKKMYDEKMQFKAQNGIKAAPRDA